MVTRLITPPASEPVTLDEAKLHLRVTHDAEDELITALIIAAREQCEHLLGRSLIEQTWERSLDAFPRGAIDLYNPTIIEVLSVKYINPATMNETTLATDQYVVDTDSEPGRITPAANLCWPAAAVITNCIRVRYTAGYADAASVPESIKAWIKLAVGTWYEQRDGLPENTVMTLPRDFFAALLDRYKVHTL